MKPGLRLEISSPGIDRPLMRVSDFRRAVGFEAKVRRTFGFDWGSRAASGFAGASTRSTRAAGGPV